MAFHDPDALPALDPNRKDSLAFIRAAIHRKAARTRENADVNSLVSDFGYLCVRPHWPNILECLLIPATAQSVPIPGTSSHPRQT